MKRPPAYDRLPNTASAPCWAFTVVFPQSAPASGPFIYDTPFFDERDLEELLAGHLTDSFRGFDLTPIISYLQLSGQMTPAHAALFRSESEERTADSDGYPWRHRWDLEELIAMHGYPEPDFEWSKTVTRTEVRDGKPVVTRYRINNCLPDAFRLAAETLKARQSLYGSGSPRLGRWIEAQIKVFSHCGNREFDPPGPPVEDWGSLETHDRHYQIAASYFYDGQYLEAKVPLPKRSPQRRLPPGVD